jgi:carbon starvation protein CstA|tara:strand:+ start:7270 stop:7605 length:336 start_codon:yes stop_codon:yes gene_type:complete
MIFLSKVLLAALVIAFASWLSGKKPELSGFIIALPIASIIAIAFSYLEHKNTENSVIFAKSILVGVPISYLFFVPFFFAKSLNMNFWLIYGSGLILLIIGYFLHRYITNLI